MKTNRGRGKGVVSKTYNMQTMQVFSGSITPPDVTTNFTYAQVSNAFFGAFNTISVANSILQYDGYGGILCYITGKSANLYCTASGTQPFFVSVDGGAESRPVLAGGKLPLFTGLSDTPHLVRIRVEGAYNGGGNRIVTNGNVFEVIGSAPSVGLGSDISTNFKILTDPAAPLLCSMYLNPNPLPSANLSPALKMPSRSVVSGHASGGAIKFRAKASDIWIFSPDNLHYIATDTGAFTLVTTTTLPAGQPNWKKLATGLDVNNFHDYMIVPAGTSIVNYSPYMIMIAGVGSAYTTLTSTKGVLQVGDSITEGRNGGDTNQGGTDLYRYANSLGIMPYAAGKAGTNVATVNSIWSTIVAALPRVPEYAVVAIGANDLPGATYEANLITMINNLLTAGVTKIVCRVIATQYDNAREQNMINAVASFANPNIIYVGGSIPSGTNNWTGISTLDGLHPNLAGYITFADYEDGPVPTALPSNVGGYAGFLTP